MMCVCLYVMINFNFIKMIFLLQDGTKHVIIGSLAKENQIQMYMTHVQPFYLHRGTYKNDLCNVILLASNNIAQDLRCKLILNCITKPSL